ncbi:MAG: hypothetical protein JKY66_05160 [Spongiibacteraceae bacterium]|nr:hypothetical protein [Spongiibacteraceae bacterium]
MLREYDCTSSVPIFANGAVTAAFASLLSEGARVHAEKSTSAGDGETVSVDAAKKTLIDSGLVTEDVLNDSSVFIDRTNEYGMYKDGKSFGALNVDEVTKLEAQGWSQVDGVGSEGGTIQIFKQATMPGHQQHTGLFGRNLTGQQNLVQTIYHEYMHYSGVPSHGNTPGTFAWQRWGRKEGRALSPIFD